MSMQDNLVFRGEGAHRFAATIANGVLKRNLDAMAREALNVCTGTSLNQGFRVNQRTRAFRDGYDGLDYTRSSREG